MANPLGLLAKPATAGGGSGIRTHDTVSRIHAFQASAFSHSAIPPRVARAQYSRGRGAHNPGPAADFRRCAVSQCGRGGGAPNPGPAVDFGPSAVPDRGMMPLRRRSLLAAVAAAS